MPDMPTYTYPARPFARAFLAVVAAAATKDNEGRHALYRSVRVMHYDEGVRLVATDATMVLTTWVPSTDHPYSSPDDNVSPVRDEVMCDHDQRVVALMRYVLKLTKDEDREDHPGDTAEVDVRWDAPAPEGEDDPVLDESLAGTWVQVSLPDREQVSVRTIQGVHWPDAHTIALAPPHASPTSMVAVNTDHLHRLGGLRTLYPDAPVRLYVREGYRQPVTLALDGEHLRGALAQVHLGAPDDEDRQTTMSVTITSDSAAALRAGAGHLTEDTAAAIVADARARLEHSPDWAQG